MKIIDQSWGWVQKPRFPLETIEAAGRTCYKSEDAITHETAPAFVEKILARGHESVIEHVSASVRFITNRGVTHELVRHRLAAYLRNRPDTSAMTGTWSLSGRYGRTGPASNTFGWPPC